MGNLEILYDEDFSLAVGALAGNDLVGGATKIDGGRLNGFRVVKTRLIGSFTGKTTAEGGVIWGLGIFPTASAAVVESILEADPQSALGQTFKQEGTWVKPMGMMRLEETEGSLHPGAGFVDVDINWSVPEGAELMVWAYNQQSGALTTGTVLNLFMQHMGVWLRD